MTHLILQYLVVPRFNLSW